jgi:membrane-associated phospholipid phosphatase
MHVLLQLINSADVSIYHYLSGFAGNWSLDRFVSFQEGNTLLKSALFLTMYWYFWFRPGPDQEKRRRAIIAILVGTLLAIVVARTVATFAPFRIRPVYNTHLVYSLSFQLPTHFDHWSSFPSDTAAYLCALAFGLWHLSRRLTIPVILYTAGWICLPRMFLGLHYASDIVAGAAIGTAIVWVSLKTGWLQSGLAPRVLAFMDAKPHVFYAAAFLVVYEMASMFWDVRGPLHSLSNAARSGVHPELILYARMVTGILCGVAAIATLFGLRRHHATLANSTPQTSGV